MYSTLTSKNRYYPTLTSEKSTQPENNPGISNTLVENNKSYMSNLKKWYILIIKKVLDFWDIIDNGTELLLTKCVEEEGLGDNIFCIFQPGFRPPEREICKTGRGNEEPDRYTLLQFHEYINIFSPLSFSVYSDEVRVYPTSKRVNFDCDARVRSINPKESLCYNLALLDRKYKCKWGGVLMY